jgi:hypothetical protein
VQRANDAGNAQLARVEHVERLRSRPASWRPGDDEQTRRQPSAYAPQMDALDS